MSYHRRYKLKDDRFGLLALTLREKADLTQTEVAAAVGVSERTIRHWESGTAYPDSANLKRLIELYLRHGAFIYGNERNEAKALWEQVVESGSRRKTLFDDIWFGIILKEQRSTQPQPKTYMQYPTVASLLHRSDWGEVVDVATFCGRQRELAELEQWIRNDRCRVVTLLGIGGIGKTTLSIRLAQTMLPDFDFIVWRSLYNAPLLEELLADCIQTLSEQYIAPTLQSGDKSITLLIELLRKRRCLLVLDNVETLLQAESLEGGYRQGYERYELLFRRIAEMSHQSCLLLTSREMLSELEPLEGSQAAVRVLKLAGLEQAASQELLKDKELHGSQQDWSHLIQRYSGNPLALKIVAATVRDLFGGDIAAFVQKGPVNLHTLQHLLNQQFAQLTRLELDILYWLAIERELILLEQLHRNFSRVLSMSELVVAVKALRRRCLIERGERVATFTLQPEVMEYVSERLVERVSEEIISVSPNLLITHALMKALSNDDIRESQGRMLIQPVLTQLLKHYRDEREVEQQLFLLLRLLREKPENAHGYGGGNLLNLLASLKGHLRHVDFSALSIRQAYLQGVGAQDANFFGAHIAESLFMEPIGSISSMTLSPDGKYLAVGSISGQICVWRVADKTLLLTLRGHSRFVWTLAFSPDSTLLASSGYDSTIKLWAIAGEEAFRGQCLQTLSGHEKWVRSLSFNADGSLLVTGGDDEMVRVWDVHKGTCLHVLGGHKGSVWSVATSPDGTCLVTGGDDEVVRVWDMRSGTCIHVLHGHTSMAMAVAFHPSGNMCASGGEDGSIHLWDALSGRHVTTLQLHSRRAASIAFNAEGTLLASGSLNGEVEVWGIAGESDPYHLRTLPGHPIWVSMVAFGPDNLLASISYGGQVKLWEVESGRCLGTIQGYSHVICTLAFNSDGSLLAHGDDHGMLRVWDVESGRCLTSFQAHAGRIWSVQFSPDGKMIASGGDDQGASVKLWKVQETPRKISEHAFRILYGHTTMIWSVAFSSDGRKIASSGFDRTVKIWEVGAQKKDDHLLILAGHTTFIWSVTFSPDGSLLASGDNDGVINVWDTKSGQCLTTLQGGSAAVGALAFNADGNILRSGDSDGNISEWQVGKEGATYIRKVVSGQGSANWTKAMAFNQDGTLLALGCDQQRIRLWHSGEKSTLRVFSTLALEGGQVWSVAFSPAGHLLASGDDDGNLMLWDVASGTVHQVLHSDRPYERMNIYGVKGITQAQRENLKALGAIEKAE